jgi:hypothetical protein
MIEPDVRWSKKAMLKCICEGVILRGNDKKTMEWWQRRFGTQQMHGPVIIGSDKNSVFICREVKEKLCVVTVLTIDMVMEPAT